MGRDQMCCAVSFVGKTSTKIHVFLTADINQHVQPGEARSDYSRVWSSVMNAVGKQNNAGVRRGRKRQLLGRKLKRKREVREPSGRKAEHLLKKRLWFYVTAHV